MNKHSVYLELSLKSWGQENFTETFKREIEALDIHQLPLQEALQYSSHVSGSGFHVNIYSFEEDLDVIRVRTGIFYQGMIAGCNCADDPSPADEQTEYCELLSSINKTTAEVSFHLLSDSP